MQQPRLWIYDFTVDVKMKQATSDYVYQPTSQMLLEIKLETNLKLQIQHWHRYIMFHWCFHPLITHPAVLKLPRPINCFNVFVAAKLKLLLHNVRFIGSCKWKTFCKCCVWFIKSQQVVISFNTDWKVRLLMLKHQRHLSFSLWVEYLIVWKDIH